MTLLTQGRSGWGEPVFILARDDENVVMDFLQGIESMGKVLPCILIKLLLELFVRGAGSMK